MIPCAQRNVLEDIVCQGWKSKTLPPGLLTQHQCLTLLMLLWLIGPISTATCQNLVEAFPEKWCLSKHYSGIKHGTSCSEKKHVRVMVRCLHALAIKCIYCTSTLSLSSLNLALGELFSVREINSEVL